MECLDFIAYVKYLAHRKVSKRQILLRFVVAYYGKFMKSFCS